MRTGGGGEQVNVGEEVGARSCRALQVIASTLALVLNEIERLWSILSRGSTLHD